MNKLKVITSETNIKKLLALKMFDQLVFPILSYGSEIWVAQDLEKLLRMDNKPRIEKIVSKLPPKKLNTLFFANTY
jgi:hypothetical protein